MTHVGPVERESEAVALAKSLLERGFSLEVAGEELHVRPPGRLAEEERAAVRRLKREIMDTLPRNGTNGINGTTAPGKAPAAVEAPPPRVDAGVVPVACRPAWDQGRADVELAAVEGRLNRALKVGAEADTEVKRRVVEVYRTVIRRYHAGRHPLLLESLQAVENLFGRWRSPPGE